MVTQIQLRSPRNPLEWIITIVVVGIVAALGVVVAGVTIVIVGIAILVAPIMGWWQRRQTRSGPRPDEPVATVEEPDGPVVDAEFEVKDDG